MLQYIAGMIYLAPNISCWLYTCSLQLYDIFGAIMDQMVWFLHGITCGQGGFKFFIISCKNGKFCVNLFNPKGFCILDELSWSGSLISAVFMWPCGLNWKIFIFFFMDFLWISCILNLSLLSHGLVLVLRIGKGLINRSFSVGLTMKELLTC